MDQTSIFKKALASLPREDVYVVGGAVRDRLLNRRTMDYDIVLPTDPKPVSEKVARVLNGRAFPLDENRGIIRVTSSHGFYFDLARRQGASLEMDLDRRDFSINAMAVPVARWTERAWNTSLVDRHEGKRDLLNKNIRFVSKSVFAEDPLRLLRAFRMAGELNFSITKDTLALIRRERKKLTKSAPERMREELLRLFSTPHSFEILLQMDKSGLLDIVFPESVSLRKTAPAYYGKGGVLKHTLDSVKHFELIQAGLSSWFPGTHKKIREYLNEKIAGYPRYAHCKWGLLLHDIGKPATAKIIKGRLRFFEHEHVGADKVNRMTTRYRWSTDETQRYSRLVRNHMRPGNLAAQPVLSDKAIHRFFRDLGEDAISMLLVSLADHLTYLTPAELRRRNSPHEKVTMKMVRRYYLHREKVLPKKVIDGHDVMMAFGLPSSPLIGTLLKEVTEAQSEGKIQTKSDALAFLKTRVKHYQTQAA